MTDFDVRRLLVPEDTATIYDNDSCVIKASIAKNDIRTSAQFCITGVSLKETGTLYISNLYFFKDDPVHIFEDNTNLSEEEKEQKEKERKENFKKAVESDIDTIEGLISDLEVYKENLWRLLKDD